MVSPAGTTWANNSVQSTSASLFSHFPAYRKAEPEPVPPLHSQASAGLSRWQNRRFLCLCLFLSPAVTPRRVAIVSSQSARGQAALPLGRPGSLWSSAEGGEPGGCGRLGSQQSGLHLNGVRTQSEDG